MSQLQAYSSPLHNAMTTAGVQASKLLIDGQPLAYHYTTARPTTDNGSKCYWGNVYHVTC